MFKKPSLQTITLIIVLVISYAMLLGGPHYLYSIDSIVEHANHFKLHVFVVSLLPVYIAVMIFGSAFISLAVTNVLKKICKYFARKKVRKK